ncbi:MAG: hypothetical protein H6537_03225 [Bacteroidales bacterium]|nr:hypothetical protein [Bacteroidales bacterium]HPD94482.1 hypothetical protein [Tenuifilaceae bacterium]HRX31773.1 hypothetical protein [Tenuifilaceae bacterium]
MHDISGKWIFSEEFECGTDKGFAIIEQDGKNINGYIEYEERIEDEETIWVRQRIKGEIEGNSVNMQGIGVESLNGEPMSGYNLDTLEGTYTHENKIVGHSYDPEDICGVFVMSRE